MPIIAAVTIKITSILERFDNTTFADAAGSDMAIFLVKILQGPSRRSSGRAANQV
jgi:hypothetical protein